MVSISVMTICAYLTLKVDGYVTYRSDATNTIQSAEGPWGDWGEWRYCSEGQYMTAVGIHYESGQGGGDDTGVNLVYMHCRGATGAEWVAADKYMGWANSISDAVCDGNSLVWGFKTNVEPPIDGDDTALNNIRIYCTDGNEKTGVVSAQWGNWGSPAFCESGEAVCGFRNKVESNQGNGDDTAVNAVQYKCCKGALTPHFSGVNGYWAPKCTGCSGRAITISSGVISQTSQSLTTDYFAELSATISGGFKFVGVEVSTTLSYGVQQSVQSSMEVSHTLEETFECDKDYMWQWVMYGQESIGLDTGSFQLYSRNMLCTQNSSPTCVPNNCNVDGTPNN